ncbi:methyltransferase family protein [Fibrobacterota bacterium]
MTHFLFAYRGWFLFGCYAIAAVFRLIGDKPINHAGLWLILGGWGIRLTAGFYIADHTNEKNFSGPSLARTGVYGLTRNPLYLGNLLASEGFLIFANCLAWPFHLTLIALVFFYYRELVRGEERYLEKTFGREYDQYLKTVPRWFNATSFFKKHAWTPATPFSEVLRIQFPNLLLSAAAVLCLWFLSIF